MTRLITVDGPAGSGKTTFAEILAERFDAAPVIHMDDLYEGWCGLDEHLTQRLDAWIVTPLRAGLPPRYLRYDWHAGRFTEWVTVPGSGWLILEGVGAGQAVVRQVAVFGVWVEAPAAVRLARGLRRDGAGLRPRWSAWQALEAEHFAADRTRDHCDAVVTT